MLFSVIIPTYNRAAQLNDALYSVFSQVGVGPRDVEVIVVDNSSTDNTVTVAESHARASGGRLKYIRINNNGIIAKSRNAGVRVSTGDYVAFLDDDDVWSPEKLATCASVFAKTGADGVYHGIRTLDGDYIPKPENYKNMIKNGNRNLALSSVVLRRGIFNDIGCFDEDPDLVGSEDFELWLRMFGSPFNYRIVCIPQVLVACSPGGFSFRSAERQSHAEVLAYRKEFMRRPHMRSRGSIVRAYMRGASRCQDPDGRRRLLMCALKSVV